MYRAEARMYTVAADSLARLPNGGRVLVYTVKCRVKNPAGALMVGELAADADSAGHVTNVRFAN